MLGRTTPDRRTRSPSGWTPTAPSARPVEPPIDRAVARCLQLTHTTSGRPAIAKRKGTPLLTLIAKCTPKGKLINPTGNEHRDVQFLETMLISSCLGRNADLYNVRDTKLLREMVVPGLLNTPQGKVTGSVSEFRALIGA
jgi:hypothetical protein